MSKNNSMSKIISKDLSTWDWEDVQHWLQNNNMQKYVDIFQRFNVTGYDLCYLTNDDLTEMKLTNFHDRNLILKNVRLMTLEQLKVNVQFEEMSLIVQLDFDPLFSSDTLGHSLGEILKIQGPMFIATTDNEILMPNIKIVELILLHPMKYKTLKVLTPKVIGSNKDLTTYETRYKYNHSSIEEEPINRGDTNNEGYVHVPESKVEKKEITADYVPYKDRARIGMADLEAEKQVLYSREKERVIGGVDKFPACAYDYSQYKSPAIKEDIYASGNNISTFRNKEFIPIPTNKIPQTNLGYTNDNNIDIDISALTGPNNIKDEIYIRQRFASENRNFRSANTGGDEKNSIEKAFNQGRKTEKGVDQFEKFDKFDKGDRFDKADDMKFEKYYDKYSDLPNDNFNERFTNNDQFAKFNSKIIPSSGGQNANPSANTIPINTNTVNQNNSISSLNYELRNKVNNMRSQLNQFGNLNSSIERKNNASNDDSSAKSVPQGNSLGLKYNIQPSTNTEAESINPKIKRGTFGNKI